ncbi:VOC family protein [Bordetella pertussis]|nr:VOC family protein [Bordetella pertussis]
MGPQAIEMAGAAVPIYLLEKATARRRPRARARGATTPRHWTPVHLDFVVDDCDRAVATAVAAGAMLEDPPHSHAWGRIAHLSDPYGNGVCILQFLGEGYDALAAAAP